MFTDFKKNGPKLSPVKSESWWRDTRPGPKAMTHGVYHPVLDVRSPKIPEYAIPIRPAEPKKPRGTV
jgi:hypothetical protein